MLLHLLPLLLFLQLVHLLLVITVQRHLDWEDGVLVVAVPFHAVAVQVAGVFHRDELSVLQFCNVLHHGSHREMYCSSNGSVAGMALMGASIFTVEQVGVDGDGSVTEIQEEQFIGQREEILPSTLAHWNQMLIQQSTLFEFHELLCGHVLAHVQLRCDLVRTGWDGFFGTGMEIAEIGEGSEGLGLQPPLPDFVGQWEAMSLRITLVQRQIQLCSPSSVCSTTHWMNCSLGTTMRLPMRSMGKPGSCMSS